jgi:hypothetical protein
MPSRTNIESGSEMEFSDNEKEAGLDCYDPESRVFPRIAQEICAGRELDKREVLLILKWKLGRLKDSNDRTVTDTNLAKINQAVKDMRKSELRISALETLQNIPGIGLATATVIVTICYPDDFTIIDWRVLQELDLFPSHLPVQNQIVKRERADYNTGDWSAANYLMEYLPKVRALAESWNCSLRDADRALWGLSVRRRVEELIQSSKIVGGDTKGALDHV